MKTEETIDFNIGAVKKMTKKDFVEQHKEHPAGIDWAAKYDELTKEEVGEKADEKTVKKAAIAEAK